MYYPAFSSSSSDDEFYPAPSNYRPSGNSQAWAPSSSNITRDNNSQGQDVKMENPEMDKILERTKKSVRAVLMASKDQLELCSLEKEYYEMYEENIPYRRLQFSSLEEFLRSIPSVCWLKSVGYSVLVSAVTDENTRHIRQMVNQTKRSKTKGKKKGGSRGGGGYSGYSGQSYRPPPQPSSSFSSNRNINNRTEKLLKSILQTSRSPMSFATLEKEFVKCYQEEIPWRRIGFSSLERYLKSLSLVFKVSGSSVSLAVSSSSPAPAPAPAQAPAKAENVEGVVKRKVRLAETSQKSVWLGRLRSLLRGRQFGFLVAKVEKSYENEWGESLPVLWRNEVRNEADIIFEDDGVRPVIVKMKAAGQTVTAASSAGLSEKVEPAVTMSVSGRSRVGGSLEGFKKEVERMESIVKIRPRGLFMSQAEKIYLKQFDVGFPKVLWDAMENAKLVSIHQEMKIVLWIK